MPQPSSAKSLPLYVLLACSVALNLVLLLRGSPHPAPEEPKGTPPPSSEASDKGAAVGGAAGQGTAAGVEASRGAAAQPASGPAAGGSATVDGWTVLGAKVDSSLARTFQVAAGEDGDALSGVFARIFVWDLDLRRDVEAGDTIAVAWRKAADGLPEIAAASLQSKRLGKTMAAYRWQAPGDPFPSYWYLDGTEAPLRLKVGPLVTYEQITSLLKDRPTHKGMDFKTPLGTEVHAPIGGTVTRTNWNWNANGNCIEIRYPDGVLAKFLHLSENRVKEGDHVSAGQVIALTGNTGHTTAPHLHYQLDRDDKVLDPLDYHGTVRRTLTPDQVAALKRDVAGFEKMLADAAAR